MPLEEWQCPHMADICQSTTYPTLMLVTDWRLSHPTMSARRGHLPSSKLRSAVSPDTFSDCSPVHSATYSETSCCRPDRSADCMRQAVSVKRRKAPPILMLSPTQQPYNHALCKDIKEDMAMRSSCRRVSLSRYRDQQQSQTLFMSTTGKTARVWGRRHVATARGSDRLSFHQPAM